MPDLRDSGDAPGFLGISRRPTRREWRRASVTFVVGMIVLTLMLLFIHPQPSLLAIGSSAPPISLRATSGEPVALPADAAGRPFVVEFFETGCAHCQQVAGSLCHEKVPVYAVDAAEDPVAALTAYQRQYAPGCTYPVLADPAMSAARAYAVSVVPTVYVVSSGHVVFAGAGLDGVAALDAAVTRAVGG